MNNFLIIAGTLYFRLSGDGDKQSHRLRNVMKITPWNIINGLYSEFAPEE
jgi:hypothetical protein